MKPDLLSCFHTYRAREMQNKNQVEWYIYYGSGELSEWGRGGGVEGETLNTRIASSFLVSCNWVQTRR